MDFGNLPPQCPPNDATPCTGEVFRLVSTAPATTADFTSHFDRYPGRTWDDECEARGLSVCLSYEAACKLRRRYKPLRTQKIAVASLQTAVGVIKQTGASVEHHTWWPENGANLPILFNLYAAEN